MQRKRFLTLFVAGLILGLGSLTTTTPLFAAASNEKVLHSFSGPDGAFPFADLTFDATGNLYSTTSQGGAYFNCGYPGCGTVFEMIPGPNGTWTEKVLYSFCPQPNCTADGYFPVAPLIFDGSGNLYGTTQDGGGTGDNGTVFELMPGQNGTWTENILRTFLGNSYPEAGLIFDPEGNLDGTTFEGGGYGTVFGIGQDPPAFNFNGTDGDQPAGGLASDAQGNIYGTTSAGGANGAGTVFELTPGPNGTWTEMILYSFGGQTYCPDGCFPSAGLIFDGAGNLYGTTIAGGSQGGSCGKEGYCGTVFELSPGPNGVWTETVLHSFGVGKDGVYPNAHLTFDSAGNVYGTTKDGGAHGFLCQQFGCGTVFKLTPGPNGVWTETVLHSFGSGKDGAAVFGGVIFDAAGNLYGTTGWGGVYGEGTVFEIMKTLAVTTTTLTSSPNPSANGQPVTFTAVVASSGGAPPDGETVSFMEGKTILGTGTLSGGMATFTTSTLKVGTNKITAVYAGDSNFKGSKSKPVKQVVQ